MCKKLKLINLKPRQILNILFFYTVDIDSLYHMLHVNNLLLKCCFSHQAELHHDDRFRSFSPIFHEWSHGRTTIHGLPFFNGTSIKWVMFTLHVVGTHVDPPITDWLVSLNGINGTHVVLMYIWILKDKWTWWAQMDM